MAAEGWVFPFDHPLAPEPGDNQAVAINTTSYTTGQSVAWVQGRDIEGWTKTKRRAVRSKLTVEHVMASAALPLFFPAVEVDPRGFRSGSLNEALIAGRSD